MLRFIRAPLRSLVVAALISFLAEPVLALIPEPPHVVHGTVTVNGAPRTWGTVALRLVGSPDAIASFPLGTLSGTPNGYVLAGPMDALEPRASGTARQGDAAQVLLDGVQVAEVTIGERGTFQDLNVSLAVPHEIVLIGGPTGLPSETASGGDVYLDVEAVDTVAGHALGFQWSAACPGPDEGTFDNQLARTPIWTAPISGGGPLHCMLTVAIDDGQGLTITASVAVTVLGAVAPDPVPQFVVAPETTVCGGQMVFDGSSSFHNNPERTIALYEWDFDYDGASFDVQATGVATASTFAGRMTPATVALRVTDDGTPPRSAIATREVHPGGENLMPAAVAGGPYAVNSGSALVLDGAASSDPDAPCGDGIASWDWDLNGDGAFGDATGPTPSVPWTLVESQLCGGRCAHLATYPIGLRATDVRGSTAVGVGAVTVSLLIFADDFANGTAKGDPDWWVRRGAWTVRGTSPAKQYYASDPAKGGISVARPAGLASLSTGRLETKLALTKGFVSYANGALVFGYGDPTHYRYVRLLQQSGAWKLQLGQVGTIGADGAGVKKTKALSGLLLGRWYRIWVDVYETGRVNVYFKTKTGTPAITYKFKAAAAGRTGYQALKARAYFDNFAAWDRGVLP